MILELFLLVVFLVVVWWLIRRLFGGKRPRRHRFRCHDCVHLLASFDDGVSCGQGGRQVFKNPVHINNCMEYERLE